jgi:hypothetical protein
MDDESKIHKYEFISCARLLLIPATIPISKYSTRHV